MGITITIFLLNAVLFPKEGDSVETIRYNLTFIRSFAFSSGYSAPVFPYIHAIKTYILICFHHGDHHYANGDGGAVNGLQYSGNRRFFEEELIRLDIPRHLPLTILMGDINGLKLTNDAFGHATGDELLQKAADILRGECQEKDVVCRVGGDEFIALLPNTTALDADAIVRRIKNHLNQTKVANIDLSISFGHETKEHPKEHIREILETAEEKMYGVKLSESKTMRSKTIEVILDTFFRNREERRHAHAVASLSESIGMALNFSEERRASLKKAGMFHDLGNIAIDPSLLHQENPLSEKDWSEIKRHPEIGYRILSGSSEYQEIAEQLLGHHEHWDGTGYPRKLKGEEIPIESRIIAIAEAYDTMTHEQLYSPALANQEAVDELKAQSGIQFDPALVTLVVYKVL